MRKILAFIILISVFNSMPARAQEIKDIRLAKDADALKIKKSDSVAKDQLDLYDLAKGLFGHKKSKKKN